MGSNLTSPKQNFIPSPFFLPRKEECSIAQAKTLGIILESLFSLIFYIRPSNQFCWLQALPATSTAATWAFSLLHLPPDWVPCF